MNGQTDIIYRQLVRLKKQTCIQTDRQEYKQTDKYESRQIAGKADRRKKSRQPTDRERRTDRQSSRPVETDR